MKEHQSRKVLHLTGARNCKTTHLKELKNTGWLWKDTRFTKTTVCDGPTSWIIVIDKKTGWCFRSFCPFGIIRTKTLTKRKTHKVKSKWTEWTNRRIYPQRVSLGWINCHHYTIVNIQLWFELTSVSVVTWKTSVVIFPWMWDFNFFCPSDETCSSNTLWYRI